MADDVLSVTEMTNQLIRQSESALAALVLAQLDLEALLIVLDQRE